MKKLSGSYHWILVLSLSILLLLIGCTQSPPVTSSADDPNQTPIAPVDQVSNGRENLATEPEAAIAGEILTEVSDLPELAEIPVEITIGMQTLGLDVFLWRDFQPISPPDGKPMLTLIKLVNPDTTEAIALEGVVANKLWVFNRAGSSEEPETGGEIWATQLDQQLPSEYMAREGPKWQPGTTVDVVVEISDAQENIYLVKAEQQVIQQTN
jgi:hypothetical protein